MRIVRIVGLAAICLGSSIVGVSSQSRPDFSGTWVPADANARPVSVSGGVFNCGAECTLTQSDQTLTVSKPANVQGVKPRDTVINLESTAGATSPAQWDGSVLVLTRALGPTKVVQKLSIEGGRLTVVSEVSPGDVAPLTQIYVKANK